MDTAQRQEALAFAAQLARAPHETIMRVFRSTTLAIETKSDGSPSPWSTARPRPSWG
jgi:hypothetical protein